MSRLADKLLNDLRVAQQTYALESLRNPGDKAEFDFGYRVGYMAGLERAVNELLTALDDERNGERDLN